MKTVFKLLVIVFLATVTGVVGEATEVPSRGDILAETVETERQVPIPVSLPKNARVQLKNGNRRSGKLVGVDSQMLTIEKRRSRPLPLKDIDFVTLDGNFWWPTSNGIIQIRGDEIPPGTESKLLVRIAGFRWKNSEFGIATILPEAVVEVNGEKVIDEIPRGVRNVISSGNSRYVVSEIKFESEGELMRITATPTLIQEDE